MSPARRKESTSITQTLIERTPEYSFIQAVRLLERSSAYKSKVSKVNPTNFVAKFNPPNTEIIRFHTNQRMEFFPSDLNSIYNESKKNNPEQWHILVNLIGLTGASGVLPYHYTELIEQRLKQKDLSLVNFFDLFNHRTISLFFQASVKYHLPIEYERNRLKKSNVNTDIYTQALLSLMGLGTKNLRNRLFTDDESLLYYSGLFSQQVKTSSGLKQILENHFSIPVKIEEFVGLWQELIDDVRTRLTSKTLPKGQNASLGQSVILGKKGWFSQGKIHIVLGPMDSKQLKRFSPGTNTLKALNEVVRFYTGIDCDYDFIIKIKNKDIPNKLVLSKNSAPIIGWNSWLTRTDVRTNLDDTVNLVVSPARLQ